MNTEPYRLLYALEQQLRAATGETAAASATWAGLGVRIRERLFAIPRGDVHEVLTAPHMTRVPNAAQWLAGVANVRGALYPIIDLGRVLGAGPIEVSPNTRLLLLNSETEPAAFLVDEVFGYRSFEPSDQRMSALDGEPESVRDLLLGGFVRDGQPWLALSLFRAARVGRDEVADHPAPAQTTEAA